MLSSLPAIQSGLSSYNTSLPALYGPNLIEQITNDTTVWSLDWEDQSSLPMFAFALQTPSERIYIDLVAADVDYSPTFPIIDDPDPFQSYLSYFKPQILANGESSAVPELTGGNVASPSSKSSSNSSALRGSGSGTGTGPPSGSKSSQYIRVEDVPVVGRLYTDDNVPRNFVSTRTIDGSGFYTTFIVSSV